jgi:hypothetical protein|tara:strand:+ start:345 stop:563 length:219 start_codon:yes stop_codon:yes gene_type:complete
MEVDEMIKTVEETIELLRRNLYHDADRHYDNVIYQPKAGVDKIDQYANTHAKEELRIIAKLEEMLQTLDLVV